MRTADLHKIFRYGVFHIQVQDEITGWHHLRFFFQLQLQNHKKIGTRLTSASSPSSSLALSDVLSCTSMWEFRKRKPSLTSERCTFAFTLIFDCKHSIYDVIRECSKVFHIVNQNFTLTFQISPLQADYVSESGCVSECVSDTHNNWTAWNSSDVQIWDTGLDLNSDSKRETHATQHQEQSGIRFRLRFVS